MSKATAAAPLSTATEVPPVLRPARQSKPTLIDAPRQTKTPAALARQLHRDNHGAAATPALSSRLSLPSHSDRRATMLPQHQGSMPGLVDTEAGHQVPICQSGQDSAPPFVSPMPGC